MQMPTVRGMNVIGTGLDVQVLKKYESLKKKTKFGYTKCLIKTLFNFDYADFKADLDGKEETHHSFIAAIANGQVFGGGLAISPNAHPADGKLNFVAVSEMKLFGIIKAFIKLKNGKLHTLKQTTTKTCESVDIITEKPCTVNVDGELYDGVPFSVKVVTNTLKMYRS
jgi:diacylglycerol kinase (ATP)